MAAVARRVRGKIKYVKVDKGFGFIVPLGYQGADVFFHWNQLMNYEMKDLRPGDVVEFETRNTTKGPRAFEVEVVKE